ncbi:MAG: hypothetical protein A2029_14200 [Chloroflexi bacterium RBG_19FT_COMBO_47_9]|nr:MAG: hypothetical protein A2029_14200 [Chloroflexi bacterium RBG_19FT_COMBO_47_9]
MWSSDRPAMRTWYFVAIRGEQLVILARLPSKDQRLIECLNDPVLHACQYICGVKWRQAAEFYPAFDLHSLNICIHEQVKACIKHQIGKKKQSNMRCRSKVIRNRRNKNKISQIKHLTTASRR